MAKAPDFLIYIFYHGFPKRQQKKRGAAHHAFLFSKESVLQLLADLGSLTDAAAQVIQLGAANITAAHGLDLLDEGGVDGEHLLHADAVGEAANGEGLLQTAVLLRDDDAL